MKVLTLVLLLLFAQTVYALPRDAQQVRAFRKANPCPVNGHIRGPCPGYQVDHRRALMNGGKDHPTNMQWLAAPDHKAKTKQDFATCRTSYSCKHAKVKKPLPWAKAKRNQRPASRVQR